MGFLGSAYIEVNQGAYYPGDWVQGHLTIDLTRPMDCSSASLQLQFKSMVCIRHEDETSAARTTAATMRHQNEAWAHICAQDDIPIPQSYLIPAATTGHCLIPFLFQLPLEAQPTHYTQRYSGYVKLVNIITAAFQLPSSAKTLSAQLELHILSTTTAVPVTVSFPPKSKGIRWLGVIWGGRVHVQVPAAGNNVLFAGQPVAFDVQVKNHSRHTFRQLQVQLVETVHYSCPKQHTVRSEIVVHCVDLEPALQPNSSMSVLSSSVPFHLPTDIQPSLCVPGVLSVAHHWELLLVNGARLGTSVTVRAKGFVQLVNAVQPPAPLPGYPKGAPRQH